MPFSFFSVFASAFKIFDMVKLMINYRINLPIKASAQYISIFRTATDGSPCMR